MKGQGQHLPQHRFDRVQTGDVGQAASHLSAAHGQHLLRRLVCLHVAVSPRCLAAVPPADRLLMWLPALRSRVGIKSLCARFGKLSVESSGFQECLYLFKGPRTVGLTIEHITTI